jgi:hypothetical protein
MCHDGNFTSFPLKIERSEKTRGRAIKSHPIQQYAGKAPNRARRQSILILFIGQIHEGKASSRTTSWLEKNLETASFIRQNDGPHAVVRQLQTVGSATTPTTSHEGLDLSHAEHPNEAPCHPRSYNGRQGRRRSPGRPPRRPTWHPSCEKMKARRRRRPLQALSGGFLQRRWGRRRKGWGRRRLGQIARAAPGEMSTNPPRVL